MNTIVRKLQGNCFKVAEYDSRCLVVKRKFSQSWRIWIPFYGSYKGIVSKLWNMNTIVW